jgi:multiple sugar transport system substrate-binding protein
MDKKKSTFQKVWLVVLALLLSGTMAIFANLRMSFAWSLEEATKPYQGKTLRMIGESLPPLEALEKVKAEFENRTGVKVVIEQYGHEEVIEKTTADFAGQTGTYDLILNPHREIGRYVENNWITPIEDFMSDPTLRDPGFDIKGKAFINQFWLEETCAYQGKMYGLPFHQISMYLWWRYDLLENPIERTDFKKKYGYELPAPPLNWKEYRDVSEFFTRKRGGKLMGQPLNHDMYGNVVQGGRHVSAWYWFLNVLYSFGGREMEIKRGDQYGPVTINSPVAVQALQYCVDMLQFSPPGSTTYTWDEAQAAQQQNIAVLGIQWDDATWAVEDPKQSKVAGKMAFSGTPIGKEKMTQVEGWSYFIPKSSKKPKLAYLFIQWAMGEKAQVAQQLSGGESGLMSTYSNPDVQKIPYVPTALYLKSNKVLSVRKFGAKNGVGVPETFLKASNPVKGNTEVSWVPKPTFPEQEQIVEAITLAVNEALTGEKTPQQALDEAAARMKKVLGAKAK